MARKKQHDVEVGLGVPEPPNAFRNVWWLPVVRGVLFIVLGLLLMIEPLEALDTLVWVLGIFLVVDGLLVAIQGFVHRKQVGWTWWLAQAVVNIVFGAAVILWPNLNETALYYVLVVWVLVLGITAIVGAAGLVRNRDLGWPWMLTFGIVSTLFGLLLVTQPVADVDVLALVVIVFGLYAFVGGAIHIVSGFAVRAAAHELGDLRARAVAAGVVVTGGSVLAAGAAGDGASGEAVTGAAASGDAAAPATPVEGMPPVIEPTGGAEPAGEAPDDVAPSGNETESWIAAGDDDIDLDVPPAEPKQPWGGSRAAELDTEVPGLDTPPLGGPEEEQNPR